MRFIEARAVAEECPGLESTAAAAAARESLIGAANTDDRMRTVKRGQEWRRDLTTRCAFRTRASADAAFADESERRCPPPVPVHIERP